MGMTLSSLGLSSVHTLNIPDYRVHTYAITVRVFGGSLVLCVLRHNAINFVWICRIAQVIIVSFHPANGFSDSLVAA